MQQPDTTNVSVTICAGQSYSFDGQTLTTSGAYSATFASVFGCDSTVNLALNIGGLIEQNLQVQICDGETYQHLGQTLSTSGTYIDTLVASGGCDSVVSLDLTVNAPIISSISETICSYDTYSFNGQILTTAGTYSDTLQSALGCDSVISLLLTVTEIDLGIMQSGFELTVNESGATYQWLKCPNNEVVTGATEQTQDFEQSGSYRVVVTKLGCTDTSECQYVTGLGIGAINNPLAVKVYPNPTQNMVTITAKEKIESVKIIDISGKTVFELNNATNQDKVDLDVSSLSSGIYTVLTYTANQVVPNYNLLTKQ